MSHQNYIIELCNTLQQQGKTPTVALIRASSHKPLALPEIVTTLQKWKKAGGKLDATPATVTAAQPETTEQRIKQLEKRVARLEALLGLQEDT